MEEKSVNAPQGDEKKKVINETGRTENWPLNLFGCTSSYLELIIAFIILFISLYPIFNVQTYKYGPPQAPYNKKIIDKNK